ncbi:hypothetical protein N657DRAFT_677645 [Parathielavia appendiculata]|uniref:Uncharacterized protein n=1 Tax=Parathielavia appendiculata TaxID=2587402 RepID=A0AAN6U626_9PEZI|nr:hypothetical protein N657DRAFT_677645 [Parathielavia appendiculata]
MWADTQSPDQPRKRFREEEDDYEVSPGGPEGFTEHRSKRLQSLPLRTSPNSKRWMDRPSFPLSNPTYASFRQAQTLTPDEPMQEGMWADEPELVPANSSSNIPADAFDCDMDMMDASEPLVGRHQPGLEGRPDLREDPYTPAPSVTGRIPTPIHCSFAAQVRGSSWTGGNPMPMHGDVLATTPEEPKAAAFSSNGMVDVSAPQPSAAAVMADWGMVQNRRLPSPISECGVEDSVESARMALDSTSMCHGGRGPLSHHITHEHPLVASLPPPRSSSAVEVRFAQRENTPAAPENGQNGNAMDVESSVGGTSPSPKKGHTRSKHTLNSWTALQPGMTRSFSIGYRADCEKCRNKVPGHFNHIIIS